MENLKRIIALLMAVSICICTLYIYAEEANNTPGELKSGNAILVDLNTNRVLYEKNSTGKITPGGIAQVLTATIVLESVDNLNTAVTADAQAVNSFDFSRNNMGILPGENLTVKDLLYCVLLADAGEAANVLGVHIAGSIDAFANMMNEKAASLGCVSSNFVNPNGGPDANQYTTLADASNIIKYAVENDTFCEIVKTKQYIIAPTNKYSKERHVNNANKFLSSINKYYNPEVTGVKTSYINNDDCGLALTYESGSTSLLCILANSPYRDGTNHANEDAKKLINFGYNYFVSHKVVSKDEIFAEVKIPNGKESNRILLVAPDNLTISLPKGYDESKIELKTDTPKKAKAPISQGDALGQINVYYNGEKYSSMVLVSDTTLNSSPIKGFINAITSFFTSPIFITAVLLIIGLFIAYTILVNRAIRRRSYTSRFR